MRRKGSRRRRRTPSSKEGAVLLASKHFLEWLECLHIRGVNEIVSRRCCRTHTSNDSKFTIFTKRLLTKKKNSSKHRAPPEIKNLVVFISTCLVKNCYRYTYVYFTCGREEEDERMLSHTHTPVALFRTPLVGKSHYETIWVIK